MCQRLCRHKGNNRSNNGAGIHRWNDIDSHPFPPFFRRVPRLKKIFFLNKIIIIIKLNIKEKRLHGLLLLENRLNAGERNNTPAAANWYYSKHERRFSSTHICGWVIRDNAIHHSRAIPKYLQSIPITLSCRVTETRRTFHTVDYTFIL